MRTGQTHAENCVLSDREAQIVRLLLAGDRAPRIARQLYLPVHTIRNQLCMVYRKLDVRSQQELVLLFRDGSGATGTLNQSCSEPTSYASQSHCAALAARPGGRRLSLPTRIAPREQPLL